MVHELVLFKREGFKDLFTSEATRQLSEGRLDQSPIIATEDKPTYVLYDPKLTFDIERGEVGGGLIGQTLEELAEKCHRRHFLREPFAVTTLPSHRVSSLGYRELPVELQDTIDFVTAYRDYKQ